MVNDADTQHLRRCVELAAETSAVGNDPFGAILVSADGMTLAEEKNGAGGGDSTRHPEFELARWAAANLSPDQRANATVYTSGEHCPMCSCAHGWVGLGRIVYAASSAQLLEWRKEVGLPPPPINALPIQDVVPHIQVDGPVPEFAVELKRLHQKGHGTF